MSDGITDEGPDIEESDLGCFLDENTEMTECLIESVFAAGPAPSLMGLLMGGTLITSLYVAGDGSTVVPAVVTILFGSVLVPILPAQYVGFAYTVVVLGITVAAFSAWTRFTHQGGF